MIPLTPEAPLPVSLLQAALPHRAPMVWIDEVLHGHDHGGLCRVRIKSDMLYAYPDGSLLKYAGIEWVAQAYGYSRAASEVQNENPASAANVFLVGIRTTLMKKIPSSTRSLLVETKLFKELPPLALVDGVVRCEDSGEEFMNVQLKLFYQ